MTNATIGNIYDDDAQVDVLDFTEKKKTHHRPRKSNGGPKHKSSSSVTRVGTQNASSPAK
jgi:hypothetical protein